MKGKTLLRGHAYEKPMRFSTQLIVISLAVSTAASAQNVSGRARASDGDSLDLSGISVRLHGIDAPELSQSCQRQRATWQCGKDASSKLASLVAGQDVVCEQKDLDDYGRIVASCRAGATDLGGAMVEAGLAVALPRFTDRYVAAEARARAAGRGLWSGDFQMPADYRAAHPRPGMKFPPDAQRAARARPPGPTGVFYRNCKEAWAAGAAPLRRGQPGYRAEMDGDGDGIACEPYRGR